VQRRSDIQLYQFVGFGIGIDTVRQEDESRFVFGLNPKEGTRKACVTIAFH
jgi:hypothetical protein